jgi:glutathione peroxidase
MKSLFNQLLLICSLGLIGMTTIQCNELVSNEDASGFYNFTLNMIDGVPQKMSTYQGKVCLIVNVASKCGYTSQYANLEKVYQEYKNKGFMVLGFPANNFGGQEPGTDQEIKTFCSSTYNVTFNMYGKISVKGNDKHPLFTFLTSGAANSNLAGEIGWNFEKFLIDKNGKLIKRYKSNIDPMSAEMKTDIENALK